ncbi:Aspartic peptidase [Cynara cardunculus var. scolymus]|uniref:Aspartic peptidase n=1 Tax=Cynara cardunculus var. scolymus TaxID=59895 RepID=A0A103YE79_CYNCS|nr:Aspartic peptidase [Cynara cardunculus var. scolymus]
MEKEDEKGRGGGDYHVQVDTGSDLLWVNCAGCANCPRNSDLGISLMLYNPKSSSSSKMITCDQDFCTSTLDSSNNECIVGMRCSYLVKYGDGSSTTGSTQQALDGILGLGQANSSIISQLAMAKKVKKTFSHCLSGSTGGGIFAIGEVVEPKVNTTPIIPKETHFNIELKAIEVGDEFLRLPRDIYDGRTRRGAIIDSGTTLAYFPNEIYNQLMRSIMVAQPNMKPHIVDHQFKCYKYLGDVDDGFPVVTFHFTNTLPMKVYPHQYLFQVQDGKDVILLGDLVLTDKLVTYNMEDQTVGWTEYNCSSSIKVKDEETGMVYERLDKFLTESEISFAASVVENRRRDAQKYA